MSSDLKKTYGLESLQFVRDVIGRDYKIDTLIGSGSYGDVYSLKCLRTKQCDRVVKLQYNDYHKIMSEVNSQRYFASYRLAPHIFCSEAVRNGKKSLVVIVMERIDGVLTDLLRDPLSNASLQQICEAVHDLIIKMCQIMALHGDLHWDNIGYRNLPNGNIKLILIDFGFSQIESRCRPDLEIAQLLRSLIVLKKKVDRGNIVYLERYFRQLYEKSYGPITTTYSTLWRGLADPHVLLHAHEIRHGKHDPVSMLEDLSLERMSSRSVTQLLDDSLNTGDYYTVNRIIESQYGKLCDVVDLPDEYFSFISIGALYRVVSCLPSSELRRVKSLLPSELVDVFKKAVRMVKR